MSVRRSARRKSLESRAMKGTSRIDFHLSDVCSFSSDATQRRRTRQDTRTRGKSGSEKRVDSRVRAGKFPIMLVFPSALRAASLGRAPTEKPHAIISLIPSLCVTFLVPRSDEYPLNSSQAFLGRSSTGKCCVPVLEVYAVRMYACWIPCMHTP